MKLAYVATTKLDLQSLANLPSSGNITYLRTYHMLRSPDELESEYHQAYVMINCEDGAQEYVIEELKSIKCVKEMSTTIGPYDIVTKIVVPSVDALRETIECKIRRIRKVRTTTTIICEQSKSFLNLIQGKTCHV